MRILLIGNYYYPEHIGGVEIVSFNLTKHYRALGHAVHWIAADVPPHFRSLQEDDVPIRSWNIAEEQFGFPHPIPFPEVFSKLYDNIKWSDVVHIQDCLYSINILAFILARLLRRPILITQYAKIIPYARTYKRFLQQIGYLTIGRWMFTGSDKLVFITSNVRESISQINPKKHYDVVPLGVDTDFYHPISERRRNELRRRLVGDANKPLILFVGRMVERKGVDLLKPLIEKHTEWHWVLVGRPDDRNPSDWRFQNLSYFQNVSEVELRDLFASADLLLHPSRGEGFTLTAAECTACGTTAVISEEALEEIDELNRSLFLAVKPEVSTIEKTLKLALQNTALLTARKPALRKYALTRLSWTSVSLVYISILNDLIKGKNRN